MEKENMAAGNYREGISVEEAVKILLDTVSVIQETEFVPILEGKGRILAKDMRADMDNPPFDRAPVDGYACRACDTKGASKDAPVYLKVLEEIDAGQFSYRFVETGQAVRIMTGAAIPKGCDCCLRQEWTDYGEKRVAVFRQMEIHDNYCDRGEDFHKGDILMKKGQEIGYVEIGNLAGMGQNKVEVYRHPRIALLTTGDEVTEPGSFLKPGKIYNSNLSMMYARLADYGAAPVWSSTLPDDTEKVSEEIKRVIASGADLIITTGGVSVGKKDIMHEVVEFLQADKIFWKVKLKPGTPVIFWSYRGVPVVSLSGNPFGAITNLELLVRPLLEKMMRKPSLKLKNVQGVMMDPFMKASSGRRYIRAKYQEGEVYLPEGLHSSGVLSSMMHCNCLVEISPGTPCLKRGDRVKVLLL